MYLGVFPACMCEIAHAFNQSWSSDGNLKKIKAYCKLKPVWWLKHLQQKSNPLFRA